MVTLTDHLQLTHRLPPLILLRIDLTVTVNLHAQFLGKGIHAGDTHTVESSGDLVGVFIELTTGMQHGEHHLDCGLVELRVHIHRDASSVIADRDRVILIDIYLDPIAIPSHRLIDGVVDHLID